MKILPYNRLFEDFQEAVKWKWAVRDGVRKKVKYSNNERMRIDPSTGKEVPKTASYKTKISKTQKKAAKKRKPKQKVAQRKAAKSNKKRTWD